MRYHSITTYDNKENILELIYQCTHKKCQHLFISTYERDPRTNNYFIKSLSPKTPLIEEFSDIITEISPDFIEIYNQSIEAESANLTQIVGIGLRKALEFLLKDYLIKINPEKEKEIKKIFLGTCINNYVDNPNLKECAKRAVWLGNDETHYTKVWKDKDINDLKLLIKLSVNWIENVELTKKYIEDMNPKSDK